MQSSALAAHRHQSRRLYTLLLGAWALLTLGSVWLALASSLQQAERNLEHHARVHFAQLRDKLRDNEAGLHAFAAQLAAVPEATSRQIRRLARQLLKHHPHVYMFELVQRVPRESLDAFVRQARRDWNADFTAKTFDYLETRTWQPLPDRDAYYLLVMLEPELPGTLALYGMDTASVPFLHTSLHKSLREGAPVASEPFHLAEDGGLAYVMYRPVPSATDGAAPRPLTDRLALLVVRVDQLFPTTQLDEANDYRLFYVSAGREITLQERPARSVGRLARWLLPELKVRYEVENVHQPVGMEVRRQLGLSDLFGVALPLVAFFSLISLGLILLYLRAHDRMLAFERKAQEELRHLALHDALTGLGNRILLQDRLEHAMKLAQRSHRPLAVLFLDLDGFKEINDRHGHAAGDALLMECARRLRASLRDTDTVARVGGDEFVVLIDALDSAADVQAVADKLRTALGRPYWIDGQEMRVTVSVGIGRYPEDGESVEALLSRADWQMYLEKRGGTGQ